MKKISLLIALSFLIHPISAQVNCGVFSSQIQYKKDSAFYDTVPKIRVEMMALAEDRGGTCQIFQQPTLTKVSLCSAAKTYYPSGSEQEYLDSQSYSCFSFKQFTGKLLILYKFYYYVPLSDLICTYQKFFTSLNYSTFDNTLDDQIPISSSLETIFTSMAIHDPYVTPYLGKYLQVEQACLGMPKEIWVTDTIPFSFYSKIEVVKPTNHLDSTTYEFDSTLSIARPIPAIDYSINKGSISFTPTDTGLFIIPVKIKKHSVDSSFGRIYEQNVQYKNLVVYVSDSCNPQKVYSETFTFQSENYSCDGIYKIPLKNSVLKSSISADGTDLKFHHPQNYPVVITKAYGTNHDPLYTDTLVIEAQFFYDGQYQVQVVAGSDGNKFTGECGGEFKSSQRFSMNVTQCNSVQQTEWNASKTEILPQPASEVVNVNGEEVISAYWLYSIGGELLQSAKVDRAEFDIPLDQFTAGFYVLKLETQSGRQITHKLVVR